jgi:hypothetical protein
MNERSITIYLGNGGQAGGKGRIGHGNEALLYDDRDGVTSKKSGGEGVCSGSGEW